MTQTLLSKDWAAFGFSGQYAYGNAFGRNFWNSWVTAYKTKMEFKTLAEAENWVLNHSFERGDYPAAFPAFYCYAALKGGKSLKEFFDENSIPLSFIGSEESFPSFSPPDAGPA